MVRFEQVLNRDNQYETDIFLKYSLKQCACYVFGNMFVLYKLL